MYASSTSSLKVRLKRSIKAFCVGFPGWIKVRSTSCLFAQSAVFCEISSGPLSMRICFGYPRQEAIISRVRITRVAGRDVSASIHKTSRLKSSMIFKVRKLLPQERLSLVKSKDQLRLAAFGCFKGVTFLLDSLFLGLTRKFRFISQYTR